MPVSVFDDTSLDERALPVIAAAHDEPPSEAELEAAALVEYAPSPVMLQSTAWWMRVRDDLTAGGMSPVEVLRVFLRAAGLAYDVAGPTDEMLASVFADTSGGPGTAVARDVCEHLIAAGRPQGPPGPRRWLLDKAGAVAIAFLAAGGDLDPRFDGLLTGTSTPMPVVRALLTALPPERREAPVLAVADNVSFLEARLDWLLAVRDLVDTPAVAAVRASAIAAAPRSERMEALIAEEAAGAPRPLHPRPTPKAQAALRHWSARRAAERRAAELGPLAERVWSERVVAVDAPELASTDAWAAAGERRRSQVAEAVAAALGPEFSLAGLRSFGGPPIAVLTRQDLAFCLVPGGSVDVGFSPEEEAEARAAAERGDWNHDDHGLFEALHLMRPLTRIAVGPMVAAQVPGSPVKPQTVTDELERSPLRLPSEAEWEYLARGGRGHEPTYRGAGVPDSEEWFEATRALGVDGANIFGLYGFGFEPEVCADVYRPGHDGLPAGGSPLRGTGPRVVKGGAAQIYPWQACGEWHLLLTAMRTPQTAWEYALSARLVTGIVIPPA